MKLTDLLNRLMLDEENDKEDILGSTRINDSALIEKFISDSSNTFLVSFPRTGSHWLRILMEMYFERPSLVRAFYYPEKTNYLTYHTHDLNLDIEHPTVIYLYRDPIETIYSQMNYYKEDLNNDEKIMYWSTLYGKHLDKWLYKDSFTTKKTVITYNGLKENIIVEFAKITEHFRAELDTQRLENIYSNVTKEEVKRKTKHDQKVVDLNQNYDNLREKFIHSKSNMIWDSLLKGQPYLKQYFTK